MGGATIPGSARLFAEYGADEVDRPLSDSLGVAEPRGVGGAGLTPIGTLSPHVSNNVATVSPFADGDGVRGGGAVGGGDNTCDLGVDVLAGRGAVGSEMVLGRNWGGSESLEDLGDGWSSAMACSTTVTGADDTFLGFRARSLVG